MFKYRVQMQREDGQVIEADYAVRWSPEKVTTESVAVSCAAEYSYFKKAKHLGLAATLITEAA